MYIECFQQATGGIDDWSKYLPREAIKIYAIIENIKGSEADKELSGIVRVSYNDDQIKGEELKKIVRMPMSADKNEFAAGISRDLYPKDHGMQMAIKYILTESCLISVDCSSGRDNSEVHKEIEELLMPFSEAISKRVKEFVDSFLSYQVD